MCKVMEDLRNESLEQGIKQGIKEEAINTTKRMLKDGTLTLEKIAEFSNLPLEEVIKIKSEQ